MPIFSLQTISKPVVIPKALCLDEPHCDRAQTVLFVADEVERNQIQQDLAKAQQAHKSAITLWQLQPKPLTVSQALRLQSFQINDVVVPQ